MNQISTNNISSRCYALRKPPLWQKPKSQQQFMDSQQTYRQRSCGIVSQNQAQWIPFKNKPLNNQNKRFQTERGCDDTGIEIKDGYIYKGQLKDGKPSGFGRLYFGTRCVHEGNWLNGMKHGKGLQYDQQSVYDGYFEYDRKNGSGLLIFNDKQLEGDWIEDNLEGVAKIKYDDGSQYEGETKDLQRDGYGKYCYDGGYYDGNWKCDKRQGSGIFYTNTGYFYDGNWSYDREQGFGVGQIQPQQWYIGQWDRGQPNGQGTMIDQNGDKQDGIFYNGKFLVDGFQYQDRQNFSIQQIIKERKKKLNILQKLKTKKQKAEKELPQNLEQNDQNELPTYEQNDLNILRDIQNTEPKRNKALSIKDIQSKLKGLRQIIMNIYQEKK